MTEPAKRWKAALFAAASLPGSPVSDENLHRRLAALRSAAEARGYEVVLERVDRAPPYAAHDVANELLEAARAGTFHALILHDARELSRSSSDASWLRQRIEAAGPWIVELRAA